jgi:hypothetical protein
MVWSGNVVVRARLASFVVGLWVFGVCLAYGLLVRWAQVLQGGRANFDLFETATNVSRVGTEGEPLLLEDVIVVLYL